MERLSAVLERTRDRALELDPVDHRGRLEHFMFDVLTLDDAANKYALVPLQADGQNGLALGQRAMTAPMTLSKLAMRQLCQRVGIPTKFVGRLEELHQDKLLGINLNVLMQHQGDGLSMLRTVAGDGLRSVRAILGSQYQPLDDHELMSVAEPHLEGAEIAFSSFGEIGTHITAVWPDEYTSEGLARGVHIANSEVGMRAITIEAVAYRKACNNILPALGLGGMGEGDQAYTQGRSYYRGKRNALEGSATSSWRMIHRGDTSRLAAFVGDAVADAKRQYESVLARWRAGLADMVPDPISALEDIAGDRGLTVDQYKSALNAWAVTRPDFGDTRTGLANAFTLAAQGETDPEDRYSMQAAGSYALARYQIRAVQD